MTLEEIGSPTRRPLLLRHYAWRDRGPGIFEKRLREVRRLISACCGQSPVVGEALAWSGLDCPYRCQRQAEHCGLYNQAGGGESDRLDVARELVDIVGLGDRIEVRPVGSDFFSDVYFAPRSP